MNPSPFSPQLMVDTSLTSPAPTPGSGSLPASLKTNTPRTLCTSPSTGPAAHTEPTLRDAKPRRTGCPGTQASSLPWPLPYAGISSTRPLLHGSRSVPGCNSSPWALQRLRQGLAHSSSFAEFPGQPPASPGVEASLHGCPAAPPPRAQQREGTGKSHACSPSLNTYCFRKLMWKVMARLTERFFSSCN